MIEGKIKVGDWFVYRYTIESTPNIYVLNQSNGSVRLTSLFDGNFKAGEIKPVDMKSISQDELHYILGIEGYEFRRYRPEDQKLLKDKLGEISMSKFKKGDIVRPIERCSYFGIKDGKYSIHRCPDKAEVIGTHCQMPHTEHFSCPILVTDNDGGYWFFPEEHLEHAVKRIKINFEGTEAEAAEKFGPGIVNALTE